MVDKFKQTWPYLLTLIMLLPFYIHGPVILLCFLGIIIYYNKLMIQTIIDYPLLMAWFIISMIVAILNRNYMGAVIPIAYFFAFVFSEVYERWVTPVKYRKMLDCIAYGSIPVALLSFYEYLRYVFTHGYSILYIFQYPNIQTRAEATFFNANYYGLFCLFVIAVALYLFAQDKHSRGNWRYILIMLVNMMAIILTGSRILIPMILVVYGVFIGLLIPKYFFPLLLVAAASVALLILFPNIIPRFGSIAYAFEDRFEIWRVGWQIFLLNPLFGHGPMSYSHLFHLYTDKSDMHSHQLLINLLANYGLVGTGMLVYILKDKIGKLWQMIRRPISLETSLLFTIIAIIFIHGLVDVSIFWTQSIYFAIIIIAPLYRLLDYNK